MLVVVGIIVVLIAMVAGGLRHVRNTAARHETTVELKICTDLLKEYETTNGLKNIEVLEGTVTVQPHVTLLPYPVWLAGWSSIPIYLDTSSPTELIGTPPHSALATLDF